LTYYKQPSSTNEEEININLETLEILGFFKLTTTFELDLEPIVLVKFQPHKGVNKNAIKMEKIA
jgi:hypothetical protein